MLTGRPAFGGETVSDTIAAILEHEPNWDCLPQTAPVGVRRVLQRCLEKDPRRRLHDIADARIEIEDAPGDPNRGMPLAAPTLPRGPARLAWILGTAGVGVVLSVAVVGLLLRTPAEAPEVRLEVSTPDTTQPESFALSPDGRLLAFEVNDNGQSKLWLRGKATNDWSPDGRFVLYHQTNPQTGPDLWVVPVENERKPFVFAGTPFVEVWGQFSPDGRWVAYQSNESGRFEIHVRPFPGPGGQRMASTSGGIYPRWRPDGRELYYLAPDGTIMAVSIAGKDSALDIGPPVALFRPQILGGGTNVVPRRQQYDVAPDGRFLINISLGDANTSPITVILNWKPDSVQ